MRRRNCTCAVFGSQPFDDLWYGLVNGLLPRGRPFRDVPGHVRVHAIPEWLQAVHDLLAVQVEAEVIVELGQQPGLGAEIRPGGQVVGQREVRHFGRPGHVLVDERRDLVQVVQVEVDVGLLTDVAVPPQNQSNSSDRMNSRLAASNTSGSCPPKPPNGNWSTLTMSAVCPTRSFR